MNRDEQRARAAEFSPCVWAGSDLIAPRDGRAGGTWVGVTLRGTWACVLNSYVAHTPCENPPSRGGIIPVLLAQANPNLALATMNFVQYRPFRIMLGDANSWTLFHWDGAALMPEANSDGQDYFLSSSSWNEAAVLAARQKAFTRWQQLGRAHDSNDIATIHRWQEAGDEATGILMRRVDAHTTSVSQIMLTDNSAPRMHYWTAAEVTAISLS